MPQYAFLLADPLELESMPARLRTLRDVGVPYTDAMIENAVRDALGQARPDTDAAAGVIERYGEATHVRAFDGDFELTTEMDALVAYLQILGQMTDLPQEIEPTAEY